MTGAGRRVPPPQVAGLWPEPRQVNVSRRTRAYQRGYVAVPSLGRPRVLVPLGVGGADRMLTRHGGKHAERAARALWRAAHRGGILHLLPVTRVSVIAEPDGIEVFLSRALSQRVRFGVLLGPPRANIKPVLQIFDDSGATIAFAKLGLSPLPVALVLNEAAALALVGQRPRESFTAPRVLFSGLWHDVPVLVQEALPLSQSGLAPTEPPFDVMAEIAAITPITSRQLGDSDFLTGIRPAAGARWHGVDTGPIVALYEALARPAECAFGSCHGDFGPWNMGTDGTRVEVWDWERFDSDSPVGIDAAHYRAQEAFAARMEPRLAWDAIVGDVTVLLTRLGLNAEAAEPAASCYLLAICSRYRRDASDSPTATLRDRVTWLTAVAGFALRSLEETAG